MTWGAYKTFTKSWITGQSQLTFDCGRGYKYAAVKIPTYAASNTGFTLYTAIQTATGGHDEFLQYSFHNSDSKSLTFVVAASAMANGRIHELHGGWRHMMLRADSAPSAAMDWQLYVSDLGHN